MKTVNGLPQELDSDSEYSMGTSGVRVRGRADVIVRACVRVCVRVRVCGRACACACGQATAKKCVRSLRPLNVHQPWTLALKLS